MDKLSFLNTDCPWEISTQNSLNLNWLLILVMTTQLKMNHDGQSIPILFRQWYNTLKATCKCPPWTSNGGTMCGRNPPRFVFSTWKKPRFFFWVDWPDERVSHPNHIHVQICSWSSKVDDQHEALVMQRRLSHACWHAQVINTTVEDHSRRRVTAKLSVIRHSSNLPTNLRRPTRNVEILDKVWWISFSLLRL